MMMTGRPGSFSLTFSSKSRPEPPGMRMSLTRICGPSSSPGAFQRGENFTGVGKTARGEVLAEQGLFQNKPDGLVIINDPDRFHVCSPFFRAFQCRPFWALPHRSRYVSIMDGDTLQGSGMSSLKSVRPGTLSHSIKPWCCWTKVCANVSPSPEPPSRPETRG
jgi:hypothetical protein